MGKITFTLFSTLLFTLFSCSKSDNSTNSPTPTHTNDYAGYDFYVSYNVCGNEMGLLKNFNPLSDYNEVTKFNIISNDIYSYGRDKYRNDPNNPQFNYSGYVKKNLASLNSNIGGKATSTYEVKVNGQDIYYLTGSDCSTCIVGGSDATMQVWKNGILTDSLKSPYFNQLNGTNISSYYFSITPGNIEIYNSDVYVSGKCRDINLDKISIGYWKNGHYTELKEANNPPNHFSKMLISKLGNIYYYSSGGYRDHSYLFKNTTDLLNGSLDDVDFEDFALDGEDVWLVGVYYDSGYRLGVYKNGKLEYSIPSDYGGTDCDFKISVIDSKIFICGYSINVDSHKVSVYEYKPTDKTITKVGNSIEHSGCTQMKIGGFQVVKK